MPGRIPTEDMPTMQAFNRYAQAQGIACFCRQTLAKYKLPRSTLRARSTPLLKRATLHMETAHAA